MSTKLANLIGELGWGSMAAMTDYNETLAQLTETYRAAKEQLEAARRELIKGVRAADASGMRQADIVRAIGHEWTREYVRKVVTGPNDFPKSTA